ncbi:hypothetical protein FQN60_004961 [Etheostoma spectabile]|uniref:Putative nucleotidyltransferase MAB21L1 n=4 Tax=Percidae TaxID=8165 RepID=A0A5J5DL21_9PERO|nr:hypothetical protein FQN60_004961 [Etheostoma spectabile]
MERLRDRRGEGQKEQVVRREGLMSNEQLTRPQLILSLYLCFAASLSTGYIIWKTHSPLSAGRSLRIIVGDTFGMQPQSGAQAGSQDSSPGVWETTQKRLVPCLPGEAKRDQGEPWSGAAGVKMSTQPASGSFSFPSQSFITDPSAVEEWKPGGRRQEPAHPPFSVHHDSFMGSLSPELLYSPCGIISGSVSVTGCDDNGSHLSIRVIPAPSTSRSAASMEFLSSLKLAPVQTAALDPSAYCETPVYNPDLCPNMIAAQAKLVYHLNKYYNEKCQSRKAAISKTIREVCKVVSDVLKEVEVQEPRFISSLSEMDNRFEGLEVISPTEFEVVLYLNQMGVFNFVDDGSLPGCAVLKLSDGRKRSMSLWVEFITASGYLSARKIRSRFQTLVAQAVDKCSYRDVVKMVADTSEVKLRIRDRYVVQITPAFKCTGIWPRSAAHWPLPHIPWPGPNRVAEVKAEGFNLLSKECYSLNGKQSSAESDAWVLQFAEAENRLILGGCRKKCLSVLKALRDRHLELPGQPLNNYHMKTLVSYECEKHPRESDWDENCLGDRLNGILLQLISCLQCRRCPHYFLPNLDLFQGKPHSALENAAKQTWRLAREILTNPKSLEKL